MSNEKPVSEEMTREQKLNKMRKDYCAVETLWLFMCIVSLLGTFVYLFFVYKMGLFSGSPLKIIFIVVLLLLVMFCIYLLPVILKKNKKYKMYSTEYKKAYIKPLLENFDYDDVKDIIEEIRSMSSDEFYLKFEAKGDAFEWVYPPAKGTPEYYDYVNELRGYWKRGTLLDMSPTLTSVIVGM